MSIFTPRRLERDRPTQQPDGFFYDDFYVCQGRMVTPTWIPASLPPALI